MANPVSEQVGVPVSQAVAPVWHGLAGAQLSPATQTLHAPCEQTLLAPQAVPSARFAPASAQEAAPPAQLTWPARQGFDGWQVNPEVQMAMHAPAWQTWFE